ncbi:MAG: tetratricopeptide repeat protein [Verrucomicrobiota bacterium]
MRLELLTIPALLLVTGLVFAPARNHDFLVWDDDKNITANPIVASGSCKLLPALWKSPYEGLYIPVTYSAWTIIAAAQFNGDEERTTLDPTWFHAANIALHLINTGILVLLLWRLTDRSSLLPVVLGAAFFAIHPLQVEAVAWATGLKDVFSTTLALISLTLYLRYCESGMHRYDTRAFNPSPWIRCLFALLFYGLAVLTKPGVVVLPLIALILEAAFYRPRAARLATVLVLFVVSIGAVASLTISSQDTSNLALPLEPVPLWARPIIALDAIGFYLVKCVVPLQLAVDYGRTPAVALSAFPLLLLAPFVLLTLIAAAYPPDRLQYTAALAVALVALAPTLGIIPFAFQAISTVADRYAYLPMIGIALLITLFLRNTNQRWPHFLVFLVAGVFAAISSIQVAHWKTSFSLFTHTLAVNPQSVIAAYNLGVVHSKNNSPDEAIAKYRLANNINPHFQPAYNNLGYLLVDQNQPAHALDPLKTAISLNPNDPDARSNLGLAFDLLKQYPEAITQHSEARRLSPDDPNIITQLGYSLANNGQLMKAIEAFATANNLSPNTDLHRVGLEKIAAQNSNPNAAEAARAALSKINSSQP